MRNTKHIILVNSHQSSYEHCRVAKSGRSLTRCCNLLIRPSPAPSATAPALSRTAAKLPLVFTNFAGHPGNLLLNRIVIPQRRKPKIKMLLVPLLLLTLSGLQAAKSESTGAKCMKHLPVEATESEEVYIFVPLQDGDRYYDTMSLTHDRT